MDKSKKRKIIFIMAALLLLCVLLSLCTGPYSISLKELWGIARAQFADITPFWDGNQENILFQIRLPRILLACMVGAALALSGAVYQGVFENPMAAPDLLGASSGAGFGAAFAIYIGLGRRLIPVSAFLFSLLTVVLVFVIGRRAKSSRTLGLVLAGIMISSLFSAGTSFIKLVADQTNQLPEITYWLMGSLTSASYEDIRFSLLPILIAVVVIMVLRWKINVLTIGEAEASTMGVNTTRIRWLSLLCATVLTAASVAVSGMIGWVGLVIPHLARKLIGNDYRYLVPASTLLGALFLLLVDNVSRNLFAVEVPIGILTAFIGAPFFLFLITRRREVF